MPTVVKAYQILRAMLNTAVDDGLIQRNPCRVRRAVLRSRVFLAVMSVVLLSADSGGWCGRPQTRITSGPISE